MRARGQLIVMLLPLTIRRTMVATPDMNFGDIRDFGVMTGAVSPTDAPARQAQRRLVRKHQNPESPPLESNPPPKSDPPKSELPPPES